MACIKHALHLNTAITWQQYGLTSLHARELPRVHGGHHHSATYCQIRYPLAEHMHLPQYLVLSPPSSMTFAKRLGMLLNKFISSGVGTVAS